MKEWMEQKLQDTVDPAKVQIWNFLGTRQIHLCQIKQVSSNIMWRVHIMMLVFYFLHCTVHLQWYDAQGTVSPCVMLTSSSHGAPCFHKQGSGDQVIKSLHLIWKKF
jgi:hypothetical protein